jgi:hypothetical protein
MTAFQAVGLQWGLEIIRLYRKAIFIARLKLIAQLAFITLAGLGLRLFLLGNARLWYDESGSVWMASLPWARMVAATGGDVHPPLYLAMLWAWVRVAATMARRGWSCWGYSPARPCGGCF